LMILSQKGKAALLHCAASSCHAQFNITLSPQGTGAPRSATCWWRCSRRRRRSR
jgi:hypothetical protein